MPLTRSMARCSSARAQVTLGSLVLAWAAGASTAADGGSAVGGPPVAVGSHAADGGLPAPAPGGAQVTVEVQKLKAVRGRILFALHVGKDTFPRKADQALRHVWVPVTSDPFTYTFEDVPPGEYAVGAAHDENDNGKIDTGIFGIPTEGLGVSNNPFSLGPPSFESAKFRVGTEPVRLVIRLR